MSRYLQGTLETFRREELRARRQFTIAYMFAIVPSLMGITLYSDLFDSSTSVPGFPNSTMHDFMLASAMILPGMFAAGFTASGLAEDLRTGLADRMELLGVSFAAATTGRLLFDGVRVLPAAIVVYAVGIQLGSDVSFDAASLVALLIMAMAWSMAYNAAFQVAAKRTASPQAVQALLPMFAPISFLSTAFFPADLMPGWAETVATWNPLSVVFKAGRELTAGSNQLSTIGAGVAVTVATFAVFFLIALKTPAAEAR